MALAYLVQHGEKEPVPGDPGLTRAPAGQPYWSVAARLRGACPYSSPMRRAREQLTASHRSPGPRSSPTPG